MGLGASHPEQGADAPGAVALSGWLEKQSETLQVYNRRYCILEHRHLRYFDDEAQHREKLPPRGTIALAHCRVTASAADGAVGNGAAGGGILIETPSDTSRLAAQRAQTRLLFRCSTAAEQRSWLRALQVASREPWDADALAAACALCSVVTFDALLHRRHHCRRCGRVACEACAAAYAALPDYGYTAPVRLCRECVGEEGPVPPPAERARRAAAAAGEASRRNESWHAAQIKKAKEERAEGAADRKAKIKEEMRRLSQSAR